MNSVRSVISTSSPARAAATNEVLHVKERQGEDKGSIEQLFVQPKLSIGAPDDPLEKEADDMADKVMRMSIPEPINFSNAGNPIQRKCAHCEEEKQLHRKEITGNSTSAVPLIVHNVLRSSGNPLDINTRSFMESRFNYDFSNVKVHDNDLAAKSANSINALAYTSGNNIVFNSGQYNSNSDSAKRLLAHELTHVVQQGSADNHGRNPIQSEQKIQMKKAAASRLKLDFRAVQNPCACVVFMHHDEPNARLTSQLLHKYCRYNLAIVDPETKDRNVDVPGNGQKDPNELFERSIIEQCWNDDKPCEDFLASNAKSRKKKVMLENAKRRFFLSIKKCSDGFQLPVIALHNNVIGDTAGYRKQVHDPKKPLNLNPIKGKIFDDTLAPGAKSADPNTAPFDDLRQWVLTNVTGVSKAEKPKNPKSILTGGPFGSKQTNIFLWCSSLDNSICQIGDPERPDNVVWVTNQDDFDKLKGTKTNVVLQTKVDPAGNSADDLSSVFVFLKDIIGVNFATAISQLDKNVQLQQSVIQNSILEIQRLQSSGEPLAQLQAIVKQGIIDVVQVPELWKRWSLLLDQYIRKATRLSQLRFVNIETPQTAYDPATSEADFRVQSFHDVMDVLNKLNLNCCDQKPAAGETETPEDKVEKSERAGA